MEQLEAEKAEAQRIIEENNRIAQEQMEQQKLELERLKAEAEKIAQENKLAAERAEAERIAAQQALEMQKQEAQKIAEEKAESERHAAEQEKQTQELLAENLKQAENNLSSNMQIFDEPEVELAVEEPSVKEEELTNFVKIQNPDEQDSNGVTLLMKACMAGNDWDVENLLANNANVNIRDRDDWTALMYAVRYQNSVEVVNKLIQKGALLRVRNKYNSTPLLFAGNYTQNPEILNILLKNRSVAEEEVFKSFIMTITNNNGSSHVKVLKAKLFINMGIDINRTWKGMTPLMYAAKYSSSTEVIKLLLDNGAKNSTINSEGKTAFDYAKNNPKLTKDSTYWKLNSN